MQIVHFGHACVLLDTGSARLLFDPGAFASGFDRARDLDGILITHSHFDHLDTDRLPRLLDANPDAELVTDPGSTEATSKLGLTPDEVRAGDSLAIGAAEITVVGGEHAVIHPEVPMPPNVGYLVSGTDGAFYHPGDALVVPEQRVDVLCLPTAAPWLRTGEAIDFLRAVSPRVAVPIHQGLLNETGQELTYGWFTRMAPEGCEVRVLTPREQTTL